MINILFLLSHTEKGGGEAVIYNFIKNIDRSKFRPFLGHVDFRKGQFIHQFRKLGIEPVDFHANHLRNLPVTLAVILRLVCFIRKNAINVVFTSGAHNHIYAALAKMITPVKIVTYVMNYYHPLLKDNPLIMRVALSLGADYYFLNCYKGLESLNELIPPDAPRKVVYHGIDKDFIYGEDKGALIRNNLGLNDKNKLISVIARLQRWKGQDIFLYAASLIIKAHPQARFCLVGGALFGMEENYPDELKRLVDKLGLTYYCWLVGHQENIRDWMLASDIIVHPLRVPDAGSVVVREAMCLGKPVVATAYDDTFELIDDGVTGILCQPDSAEDLASKLVKLLDDENLSRKIGEAARGVALERFSVETMSREIEDVLGSIASEDKECILFTFSSCKRSGHEMSMRNIIKVLDREKYKPLALFLCLSEEGAFPDELRRLGVEVIVKRIGRLRQPINLLRTVNYLVHLIKEKNVRLVFTAGGCSHPYARLASLLTRRPIIAHETFVFKRYFWQDGPIHALNFLLGTDAYVAGGRLASEHLLRASIWKVPTYHLPYMVDLDIFDYRKSGAQLRKHLNIPMDAFVFSMVARIQEWKGQDIFIESAIQVLKETPGIYFLVFGEPTFDKDKIYLGSLKKRVESSGFSRQIIFAGYLEESMYAYAASCVICHCSKTPEPFGMVLIEAFSMKKPVIGTDNGGTLEVIEDGVDGWIVSSGSVEELVLAMKRCLKERDRLAVMGERGYQKVVNIYNQQRFALGVNSIITKYAQKF